jgi:hypothetical protein
MKNGINLKQFKKYLIKNYGEMCHDYCWDCIVCRVWKVFDDLEGMIWYDSILQEEGMLPPPKKHK